MIQRAKSLIILGLLVWIAIGYGIWRITDIDAAKFSQQDILGIAFLHLSFGVFYLINCGWLVKSLPLLLQDLVESPRDYRIVVLSVFQILCIFGLLSIITEGHPYNDILAILAILVTPQLALSLPPRILLIMIFIINAFLSSATASDEPYIIGSLLFLFHLILFGTVRVFYNEQIAKEKQNRLYGELKATQLMLAASTRESERVRIARELHDRLGHQLTALSLQLEVVSHIVDQNILKDIQLSQQLAKSLLHDVREVVEELREGDDRDLQILIDELINNLKHIKSVIQISIDIDTDLNIVDKRYITTFYRCIQEAITNTLRHADATQINIKLYSETNQLRLIIQDNGRGTDVKQWGNGLKGMHERLQPINGELSTQSRKDFVKGFLVDIKVPQPTV